MVGKRYRSGIAGPRHGGISGRATAKSRKYARYRQIGANGLLRCRKSPRARRTVEPSGGESRPHKAETQKQDCDSRKTAAICEKNPLSDKKNRAVDKNRDGDTKAASSGKGGAVCSDGRVAVLCADHDVTARNPYPASSYDRVTSTAARSSRARRNRRAALRSEGGGLVRLQLPGRGISPRQAAWCLIAPASGTTRRMVHRQNGCQAHRRLHHRR